MTWQATSYDQPDDLLIIPLSQSCVMIEGHDVDQKLGGGGTAASQKFFFMPGTHQNMGKLVAYRTSDMKEVWSWQQRSPFLTAVLSTAGGVAFIGDFNRSFKAVDVKTGKIIWQTRLGNTVQGYPVSFSLDGKPVYRRGLGPGRRQSAAEADHAAGRGASPLDRATAVCVRVAGLAPAPPTSPWPAMVDDPASAGVAEPAARPSSRRSSLSHVRWTCSRAARAALHGMNMCTLMMTNSPVTSWN